MLMDSGLYEQQDPDQKEFNLRGKFKTGPDGEYSFYCIRPTPYPVPDDGPAGQVLQMLDRHPYRPAHIHLIVSEMLRVTLLSVVDKQLGPSRRVQAGHHSDFRC